MCRDARDHGATVAVQHLTRFGHSELRVDQMPPPITEYLRRSPTLAVGEKGPIGNVAWFVRIPLVHD